LLAAALPAAPGSATASLLSLAGGGVTATPTRLAIATNGHQQHLAQLAPSPASPSPSAWSGGALAGGGSGHNGPCSTLFVANLGHSCTESQLTDVFQRFVLFQC